MPSQAGSNVSRRVFAFSLICWSLSSAGVVPCWADDWGYEQPHEVKPIKAVALPLKPAAVSAPIKKVASAPRSTPPQVKSHAAPKAVAPSGTSGVPNVTATKADYATECWNQLYQIASGKKLSEDEKKRLAGVVKKSPNAQAVTVFWPKVTEYLLAHPEQKENYVRLLRALLRWKARMLVATTDGATPSSVATEESALITEVLGPERLAVQGSPAFSEEAVEAYADMACFLYEQNNPGKTIDAFDNRAMFASVVCEKFRNAPTDKDKRAMAAFDLQWAKFKVAWESANEGQRKELLSLLQKSGAGAAGASVQNPVVKSILDNWKI